MHKPKNISYLISQYPAISHTFIMREIRFLRMNGFHIHVASINSPGFSQNPTPEEIQEASQTYCIKQTSFLRIFLTIISTVFLHPIGFWKGLGYALYSNCDNIKRTVYNLFYFIEAILVGAWMKNDDTTHLHVHFANPASQVALLMTKIYPFTFSMTVHGPDEFSDVTLHNIKNKVEVAKFVCCIGFYASSQLKRITQPKIWHKFEIAPLGVDLNQYSPTSYRESPNPFQILCIGRLVPAKGHATLLDAMQILTSKRYNIRLSLIGDGPQKHILEQEAEKLGLTPFVEFTGALNPEMVIEALKKSDLFVLPSFAEGIPVSLMEAMSMEIPCIATFVNGIPELIRHGIDGLLVTPSNSKELADSIASLIDQPDLRLALSKAGRKRIKEKYNFSINTKHLGNVFEKHLFHNAE